MDPAEEPPDAPGSLSPAVVEMVDELHEPELRALIDYAGKRQQYLHTAVSEQIEPAPGEEIVRIEERAGYTEVVKREPCGEDCSDCPHGPFLYHVREETRPNGEQHLHWEFLGKINE